MSTRTVARAPLPMRVALIVLAVAVACLAALTVVNLSAAVLHDEATQALERNVADAADDTSNLEMLRIRQQQVDAQFEDAGRYGMALLPALRSSIETNAAVSQVLTQRIQEELDRQQQGDTDTTDSSDTQEDGTASEGGGLTEEQRRRVEELLQSNQSSTPAESSGTDPQDGDSANGGDGGESTVESKPW